MAASLEQIRGLAEEFLTRYYHALHNGDIPYLGARYNESSQFSWESETFTGPAEILQKISELRRIGKFDVSSSSAQLRDNILIVLLTGSITMEGQAHGMNYTECFVVTVSRDANGGLVSVILNQVSKLAL